MNSILQALLANGASGQIIEFALNWALSQPVATNICKNLNWDVSNLRSTILGAIEYASKSYQNRVPFAKTIEQRMADTTKIYQEMVGFESLSELEKRVLSARMAGFNVREIQSGMGLEDKYSVEQLSAMVDTAQKKYSDVAKMAGIGVVGGNVEQSSKVDLNAIFKPILAEKSAEKSANNTPANTQEKVQ